MNKKIVIALGGNALGHTNEEEIKNTKFVAEKITDLKEAGYDIVITHGNGPQVGKINKAMESTHDDIPFSECGAMSEGYIGYHLIQAINNEFLKRNIKENISCILTQVVVDKNDEAFKTPTKPIGNYYSKEEAEEISSKTKDIFKEEIGKGYRKVIASPKPIEIIEKDIIKKLIEDHNIVIACGGGGIPVIKENNTLKGIDAVIDKDLCSGLLAQEINADIFLILTNVEKVYINYKQKNEKALDRLNLKEAENYILQNHFKEGSVLPKVKACIEFTKNTNNKSIITSLENVKEGLNEETGTFFY